MINHEFGLDKSFQKVCTEFLTGLMTVLVGLLNQLSLSALIFQLVDH